MVKLGVGIGAVLLGAGIVLSSLGLVVTGVAVLLGTGFAFSVRQNKAASARDLMETIRPEDRVRLRPMLRLKDEIAQIVAANRQSTSIAIIGQEALEEAERLGVHVAEMLQLRAKVRRPMAQSANPSVAAERLEAELEIAGSELERQALEAAVAARKLEGDHYGKVQEAIDRIDSNVKQAEATLAEMKARLLAAAAQGAENDDELRDTLSRLRSLDKSLDEAEQLLRVHL